MIPADVFPSDCINERSDHQNCLLPLTSDHELTIDNSCIHITQSQLENKKFPTTNRPNLYTFRIGPGHNKTSTFDTLEHTLLDDVKVSNEWCKETGLSKGDSSSRITSDHNVTSSCTCAINTVQKSSSTTVYASIVGDIRKYVDGNHRKCEKDYKPGAIYI